MIAIGTATAILVMTAQCVGDGARLMSEDIGVKSGGAAACMITGDASGRRPEFVVRTSGFAGRAVGDIGSSRRSAIRTTRELAREAMARLEPSVVYRHLILNNYRRSSQRFIALLSGQDDDNRFRGSVDDVGHCYAADILINTSLAVDPPSLEDGDPLLLLATGPRTWGLIDLEYRESGS